ncbi:MAG TPA: hypothetical protein VEU08_17135 [Vicinamibacterales bacterium]|nr:hypothetical protein [Vicinamibacterales bacterium]
MPDTLFDLSAPRRGRVQSESLEEQLVRAGLPRPRREYAFAKTLFGRDWKFDYCWFDPFRIALEVEGALFGGRVVNAGVGAFEYRKNRKTGEKIRVAIEAGTILRLGGRHNTGEGLRRDLEKYFYASALGWVLVKAMPDDVRSGEAVRLAQEAFTFRRKYCPLAGHTEFPELTFRSPAAPASPVSTEPRRVPRPAPVPW